MCKTSEFFLSSCVDATASMTKQHPSPHTCFKFHAHTTSRVITYQRAFSFANQNPHNVWWPVGLLAAKSCNFSDPAKITTAPHWFVQILVTMKNQETPNHTKSNDQTWLQISWIFWNIKRENKNLWKTDRHIGLAAVPLPTWDFTKKCFRHENLLKLQETVTLWQPLTWCTWLVVFLFPVTSSIFCNYALKHDSTRGEEKIWRWVLIRHPCSIQLLGVFHSFCEMTSWVPSQSEFKNVLNRLPSNQPPTQKRPDSQGLPLGCHFKHDARDNHFQWFWQALGVPFQVQTLNARLSWFSKAKSSIVKSVD